MNDTPVSKLEKERKEKGASPRKPAAETVATPTTLTAYYIDTKVKAHRFVDALQKAKVHAFTQEDIAQALSQLETLDPSLDRTAAILIAARKVEARPMLGLLMDWVGLVVECLAQQACAAATLPGEIGSVHPEVLVRTFVQSLRPKLDGPSAERSRAVAIVRLVLSFVGARGPADPISIARVVCRGLDVGKSKKITTSQVLRDRALGLLVTADLRVLDQAIALADLGEVMLKEATENATRSQSEAADQRRRVQHLNSELETARHEFSTLQARLAASEASARQSERDAQDHKLIRTNTDQQTRGRMTSFVRDNLLPTVEQALDASELKPPRPEILQSLLRRIEEDLRKQMTWLTAPSE